MWDEWGAQLSEYPKYLHSRLKKGWGLGAQTSYKPWFRIRDVPSEGTSGPPLGIKIRRSYQLISTPERIYFYLLDREPDVVDIREQFPILDINATLKLSSELGIRHPARGGFPDPFTIDFFVTRRTPGGIVHEARSIKTPDDADDPETRRRLSLEFRWCKDNGIDWKLVDTRQFSDHMLSTLIFMRGWFRQRYEPDEESAARFTDVFTKVYRRNLLLGQLLKLCSAALHLGEGKALTQFQYCVWSDRIAVDLTAELRLDFPVVRNGA